MIQVGDPAKLDPTLPPRDYLNLSDEDKNNMMCDEVFGIYVSEIAHKVNQGFLDQVLKYIVFYRECLNQHGWEKRA